MAYPTPSKKSASVKNNASSSAKKQSEAGSVFKGIITLVAFLVIVVGGIYLIKTFGNSISGPKYTFDSEYQAVFLTNGQVYFGKAVDGGLDSIVLRDIYYLQVVSQPLQGTQEVGEDDSLPAAEDDNQRLTLVKLGNELHGPKDVMYINRDHVVLMEDLRDDSRVIQAIKEYQTSAQ